MKKATESLPPMDELLKGEAFRSFRTLMDLMPQIVWVADSRAQAVYCNSAVFAFTGKKQAELIDKGWHAIIHSDDVDKLVEAWAASIAGKAESLLEFRTLSAAGDYEWFKMTRGPFGVPGFADLWFGVAENINASRVHEQLLEARVRERTAELERVNQELLESKMLFESFAENSPVMYLVKDSSSRYRYMNPYARAFFGLPEGEYGLTPRDLFPGGEGEKIIANDRLVLERKQAVDVVELASTAAHGETQFQCKKFPMAYNGEEHIGVVAMDVTEFVRVERELRDKEELLGIILDSLTDGVLVADVSGRFLLENKACYEMIRATDTDITPAQWSQVFRCYHPDQKTPFTMEELPLYRAIHGESSDNVEMFALWQGGSVQRYMNLSISGRPLCDGSGKVVGGLIVLRNMTEMKAASLKLSSSNAELQRFAYVAAHDLQEPLRTVASYVDLLRRRYDGVLDERARSYIDGALDGSRRMQRLIDDLLALSRIETQAHPFADVDTNEVVAAVLSSLKYAVDESQVKMSVSPLPIVRADASQLRQLFQNLIANAIKFRAQSVPEVTVSAEKDGCQWLFSVKDNGIGIPVEHAERIFQVFQRLHGQSEYPGTGIGLAICRKIVERHGGKIWVEPAAGGGSQFMFTIPE